MQNKFYLLAGNAYQKNAISFLRQSKEIGLELDGIILLSNVDSKRSFSKRLITKMKSMFQKLVDKVFFKAYLDFKNIEASWNLANANSWNLLNPHGNIHTNKGDIPVISLKEWSANAILKILPQGVNHYVAIYGGGIFSKEFVNIPHVHFMNAHMGKMPKYRGMNVLEWAILNDDEPYVSVMELNNAIDGGPVYFETRIDVSSSKDIFQLRKAGYEQCFRAMVDCFMLIKNQDVSGKEQDKGATYYYSMHPKIRHALINKLFSS